MSERTYGRPTAEAWGRFWAKVGEVGDCWEWNASRTKSGYGQCNPEYGTRLAHRAAYIFMVGDPGALQLDHLCRNRACVNPYHLEPVTSKVNNGRGLQGARESARTHCPYGHPYAGENLRLLTNGKRVCRACVRRRVKEQRAKGVRYDRKATSDA